jgi:hypothetical protein
MPHRSCRLDISFQFPVLPIDDRTGQCRCLLRRLMLFDFDSHLCDSAMALKLARPDVWPLWSTVCVAGSDLQVPRAIVSDEKASDVLEAEGLHRGVVLERADLRSGQWVWDGKGS